MIHIAIPSREMFQGAEISPAAGVTIASVANSKRSELSQNVAWWDVTVTVARDAAPGSRSLVLVTAAGRSTPTGLMIPDHVPAISDVRVVSATPSAVDVQFAAADEKGRPRRSPGTSGSRSRVAESRRSASSREADRRHRAGIDSTSAAAPCDLELRASDAQRIDSNSLKTRIP